MTTIVRTGLRAISDAWERVGQHEAFRATGDVKIKRDLHILRVATGNQNVVWQSKLGDRYYNFGRGRAREIFCGLSQLFDDGLDEWQVSKLAAVAGFLARCRLSGFRLVLPAQKWMSLTKIVRGDATGWDELPTAKRLISTRDRRGKLARKI